MISFHKLVSLSSGKALSRARRECGGDAEVQILDLVRPIWLKNRDLHMYVLLHECTSIYTLAHIGGTRSADDTTLNDVDRMVVVPRQVKEQVYPLISTTSTTL